MGSFSNKEIEAAVIYCRVSSDKQVKQGHGLDGQEHRCRGYAEQHGYTVESVFRDEAISGGSDYRPAFFRLLDYIEKQKKPFAVIFDDLNRLARDVVVARTLKVAVAKAGGQMHCVNFEYEDTPENQLFETLVVATGEFERLKNRERVIARQQARLEAGYWVFAPPRGYEYQKIEGVGKLLVPHEPNASIIKSGFKKYATGELHSQTDVANYFNAQRLLNRSGKPHSISVHEVKRILTRTTYCGDIEYKKWKIKRRVGKHEPLISVDVFERVQDRIKGRKRQVYKSDIASDFPLRGFLVCSCCGSQLTASWSKGRNNRYPYYRCPNTKGCNVSPKSDRRGRVESQFEQLLKSVTPKKELIKLTQAITKDFLASKAVEYQNVCELHKKTATKLESQIDSLIDQISMVSSQTVIDRLEQRIEALEQDKHKQEVEAQQASQLLPDIALVNDRLFDFLGNPSRYWSEGSLKQKRLVQNMVFSDPLNYSKQSGFGTANLSLPFMVLAMKGKDKCSLVEAAGIEK